VDQVFVERAFVCEGQPLVCRWFNPERREYVASNGNSGEEYHCRWSIAWPEHEETQTIVGIDGVQALMLAMRNAHGALLRRRERDALDIRWLDENQLGLPNRDEEL
jgi:hypothetical protein